MVPETAGGCVQPGPAQRPSPKLCLRSHCWREGRQSALTVHHLVSRCEKSELLLHAKGSQFTVGGGGGCTPAGLAQLPVACCGKWAVCGLSGGSDPSRGFTSHTCCSVLAFSPPRVRAGQRAPPTVPGHRAPSLPSCLCTVKPCWEF